MKHALLSILVFISFFSSAQLNLQWQELGPDNMGGNINALLLDKRDASRQTLYAGSLGGGIWKTTSGGGWWDFMGCIGNYSISSIVQANDGTIYFGTGGNLAYNGGSIFNEGNIGNGIYRIDVGDQIVHLASTNADSLQSKWRYVNRMAVNPFNANQLIVATGYGMWKSDDAGLSWNAITITGITNGQSAIDVKWSTDGRLILAAVGGSNKLVRSQDGGSTWDKISNATNAGFPATQGRIEIAIAPSNSNVAYVSIATASGQTYGVLKTMDAGNTWDTIAKRNGYFNPFSSNGQGWYDNAITVSPVDSSKLFIGGAYMYSYSPATGIKRLYNFSDPDIDSSSYLDQFGYVINDLDPNEVYVYSDRGIFKSSDADIHIAAPVFYSKHYGLKARDFSSVAATKNGKVLGKSAEGRGLLISNFPTQHFTRIFESESGGFCDVSQLDTNHFFTESYFAHMQESFTGGNLFFPVFDDNIDPLNYNEPSRCGGQWNQNASFNASFRLFETKNAFNTLDSVTFTATSNYVAGDTITATSATAHTTFKTTTPVNINTGSSVKIADPVQSRLFLTSNCGIWMKLHALSSIFPVWYRVNKSSNGTAYCYAVSKDGNILYAGTASGRVYKITGLNFANYAYWDMADSFATTSSTVTVNGKPIESIAMDPNNDSILICTIAGYYANQPNVYRSTDAGQTWSPLQAGPVGIPAYACVIEANNSNNYIVGTEHGIWTSTNAGGNWQSDYGDMCDIPVFQLRQIPLLTDDCMVLYAATNSRGLWRSFTLTPAGCNTSVGIKEAGNVSAFQFKVYPNPTSGYLNIEFELPNSQPVQINLVDLQGRKLQSFKEQFTSGKQVSVINVIGLSAGVYFVQVETKEASSTRKIAITN